MFATKEASVFVRWVELRSVVGWNDCVPAHGVLMPGREPDGAEYQDLLATREPAGGEDPATAGCPEKDSQDLPGQPIHLGR
jgi:hypothetical protein